jgi:hypothetical protein
MRSAGRIDQLRGDPHPVLRFSHAPFKDIVHAEFASDLFHVDCPPLVRKGRIASDYE